jgi:hypothetical protein
MAQRKVITMKWKDRGLEQRIKSREMIILLFCVVIGFALRFYTFDQKSLWMDEIYTFNDSRDDFRGQLNYYRENPTNLHPPLFFLLTHLFYPFTHPERDLRIIPLIFGSASIPMIYFLSRLFLPAVALPCTLSLAFMAYHISLSQDGRCYTLIMFLGMVALYFFMKHKRTSNKVYLLWTAIFASMLFYMSYASIPFIFLFQLLWLYQGKDDKKPTVTSFLVLNGLILSICIPWLIFVTLNYKTHSQIDFGATEAPGSFGYMLYGVAKDWTLFPPLAVSSIILLILLPLFSKKRRDGLILLCLLALPLGGIYLFGRLLNVSHFVSSRYFINFLPLFFISLYLSLNNIEARFDRLRRFLRLKLFFVLLLIASNLLILPLYYRSEKQDYRGLMSYLKGQLRNGDKVIAGNVIQIGVMLHHLGVYPEGRHYVIPALKVSETEIENRINLKYQNISFTILCSKSNWFNYLSDGSRLWIVADKENARIVKERLHCVLKGIFDGRVLNLDRFPTDATVYLFLWDPSSPDEKGIDLPIQ